MKWLILIAFFPCVVFSAELSSSDIETFWVNGAEGKRKVLEIAEDRLSSDEDDIVALLLKLEYHMVYMENLDALVNLSNKIRSIGKFIETENFSNKFHELDESLQLLELHVSEVKKTGGPIDWTVEKKNKVKYMATIEYIKAYELDQLESGLDGRHFKQNSSKHVIEDDLKEFKWKIVLLVAFAFAFAFLVFVLFLFKKKSS